MLNKNPVFLPFHDATGSCRRCPEFYPLISCIYAEHADYLQRRRHHTKLIVVYTRWRAPVIL